jgi:Flp pilus assembly pilin Flp
MKIRRAVPRRRRAPLHVGNIFRGDVIVKNLIVRFVREDEGQDIIEYALLAAFVSIIAATIIQSIGGDLTSIFTAVQKQTGAAAS